VQHVKFFIPSVLATLLLAAPALAQQGGATTAKNAIGWPPKLEVGQQWYAGIGKAGFAINLNAKDADGDPMGTATGTDSKVYQVFFFFNKSTGFADLYLRNTAASYRCIFNDKSISTTNPNDATMVGAAFLYDAKVSDPAKRFVAQQEPCLVTWTNAPNAPVSIQTGTVPAAPVTTPPAASSTPAPTSPAAPAATTPPPASSAPNTATAAVKLPATSLALTWPPKITAPQKWYLALGSSGYDLELTRTAANGISSGSATSGATKLESFFYFNGNENRAVLEMAATTYTVYCYFGIRGAEDKVLNGDAAYKAGNGNIQPLKDKCALYLVSTPATVSLLRQPLL
jgi:hypothetical protein